MTAPLLDTHAWVWWMSRDPRLPLATLAALDELPAGERPFVSDISLWEVAMLDERHRLKLNSPLDQWLETAAHPRTVRVVPLTPAIAVGTAALPSSFHRDPADRIIVATSRVLQIPLLTYDRRITRSRLVTRWTL